MCEVCVTWVRKGGKADNTVSSLATCVHAHVHTYTRALFTIHPVWSGTCSSACTTQVRGGVTRGTGRCQLCVFKNCMTSLDSHSCSAQPQLPALCITQACALCPLAWHATVVMDVCTVHDTGVHARGNAEFS